MVIAWPLFLITLEDPILFCTSTLGSRANGFSFLICLLTVSSSAYSSLMDGAGKFCSEFSITALKVGNQDNSTSMLTLNWHTALGTRWGLGAERGSIAIDVIRTYIVRSDHIADHLTSFLWKGQKAMSWFNKGISCHLKFQIVTEYSDRTATNKRRLQIS